MAIKSLMGGVRYLIRTRQGLFSMLQNTFLVNCQQYFQKMNPEPRSKAVKRFVGEFKHFLKTMQKLYLYRVPKKKVGLAKYYFLGNKQAYSAFH